MQERLQKLIAQAGIASRRASEQLITAGEVSVNGEIVTELGTKADPDKDHIKVRGKLINTKLQNRANVYILLNKPKGYLSSAADPEGRKLVTDLVKGRGRLHPVGRLDYNTEGLIILTNDGEFTNFVSSSKTIPKVYEVKVKGLPTTVAINKLAARRPARRRLQDRTRRNQRTKTDRQERLVRGNATRGPQSADPKNVRHDRPLGRQTQTRRHRPDHGSVLTRWRKPPAHC